LGQWKSGNPIRDPHVAITDSILLRTKKTVMLCLYTIGVMREHEMCFLVKMHVFLPLAAFKCDV